MLQRLTTTSACIIILALTASARTASACPFCSAASKTLSEEIDDAEAVVLAKFVRLAPADASGGTDSTPGSLTTGKATFRISETLKGNDLLKKTEEIEVIYFGGPSRESTFMITALGSPKLDWTTPLPLSETALEYIKRLPKLAKEGADRLEFFQAYLENKDIMLAQDAYDEFARAPYAAVQGLKDRMDRDELVAWIKSPEVIPSRRRLYLTMLGVCGTAKDLPMLESMIASKDPKQKMGLDAMIGCYLTLMGADGLPLIEDLFLKNAESEYKDTYSAVMALRFHGQESEVIPRERLLQSMRYLLDHPDLADQIIPDLARWKDWSMVDRLVQLFKDSGETSKWVRVPIINYLRQCAQQEKNDVGTAAQAAIDELAKLDPESVERANSFYFFGSLASSAAKKEAGAATPEDPKPDTTNGTDEPVLYAAAGTSQSAEPPSDGKLEPNDTSNTLDSTAPLGATDVSVENSVENSIENREADVPSDSDVASTANRPESEPSAVAAVPPDGDGVANVDTASGIRSSAVDLDSPPAPHRMAIIGATLGLVLGFFLLFWWILRRPNEQPVA